MKRLNKTLTFTLLAVLVSSCGSESKEASSVKTPDITFSKEGDAYLIKGKDTVKHLDIEFAEDDYERQTGLMYRKSMLDTQGMLFIYPNEAPRSFYMKNTYIPLDIIFYSKDSSVVSFQENAKPLDENSLPSNLPAQFILEVNAGKVKEWNIETGDKISFSKTATSN
jgi:uncharacterized protein